MAEEVQAALDRMVPALNDLRERQVFTPEEIRAVVDRRRTQEYNLRRVQPRKADFLRYLQDEMQLEALRKLRVRRLQREEKERQRGQPRPTEHDKTTKHIGDQHIVSHLHHIWTRTLRKYKADVSLYLEYASFCKEVHAHQTLSRVYGEALRLHPNKMNLWIEAASHEFFAAGSVQNARILLQRGLRIHPTAENLWIQHFSLELHFAIKMMGRQQVLQGRLPTDDEAFDRFQLARIVYQSAVSKVPAVRFRVRLWDQCRLFPHTEALKLFILHSIREECGEEPEAWLAWALFASEKEIEKAQENLTDENEEDEGEPGFLRAVGDEENDNHGEPDSKKQKAGDGSAAVKTDINDESLLDILKRATETIQSEEMYLKAGRMVNRYIDDRQAGNESIVAAVEFLETVLEKAARSSFYSADLALEQASFLTRCGTEDKAIACLSDFVATHKDTTASVWIQLASLDEAHRIDILSRASKQLPVTSKDHFCILLHQFGAKLQAGRTEDLLALLERVILLAPGFKSDLVLAESPFGVDGMADVCVQYLKYVHEAEGVAAARRVYGAVLYRSTVAKDLVQVDQDTMLEFFDTAIDAEQSVEDTKERSRSLRRLYDVIIGLLGDTPLADDFRQRRREDLANARSPAVSRPSIPSLDAHSSSAFSNSFDKYQVVLLRNLPRASGHNSLSWKELHGVFAKVGPADRESWCIETEGDAIGASELTPTTFLAPKRTNHRAYCSFLVQKNQEVYAQIEEKLPVKVLPGVDWSYEQALWFFFGRNPAGNGDLPGRPEHTDSISADGTWHFQLSGTKVWTIRPSQALIEHFRQVLKPSEMTMWSSSSCVEVTCRPGDVLVINTRLWRHKTHIPSQAAPSVSYARDFWRKQSTSTSATMSNVDGLYATDEIEAGTVIFTEETMPDGSLGRSSEPNCDRLELEDGQLAIVSSRDIAAGEFFCIAETDEESDSSEVDEEASDM